MSFSLSLLFFFRPQGIWELFADHGFNPCPLHWKHSLNHWITREVPSFSCFYCLFRNTVFASIILIHPAFMDVCVLSCVRLFVTPSTVAHQAPLSVVFSGQGYWSGLPFPTPEDLPDPGNKPASPTLAGGFFMTSAT